MTQDPQTRKQPRRDRLSTYQKAAGSPVAVLRDEQQPLAGGPGDGCSSGWDATGEQRRYPPHLTVKRARAHAPRLAWLAPTRPWSLLCVLFAALGSRFGCPSPRLARVHTGGPLYGVVGSVSNKIFPSAIYLLSYLPSSSSSYMIQL